MAAPVLDYRASRGAEIAAVEFNVRRVSEHEYLVKSQFGEGWYHVVSGELGWLCDCPDAMFRGVKCKHQFAVELSLQIRRRIENARRVVPLDYQACLCGSQDFKKDGILHNKGGDIQRFECKGCGKKFSKNLGFERMRASPEAITLAMQLYFSGESLRNVQKALRLQGVNFSHVSIFNWIRKYVSLMDGYLKDFTPEVSDTWRADELYVKVKGDLKYLFSMMDDETRFWIAQQVSSHKENTNATGLFRNARKAAGKEPKTLITDGLNSYRMASEFEYPHTTHVREVTLEGSVHNNIYDVLKGCSSLVTLRSHQEAGTHLFEDLPHFPYSPLRGALPTQNDEDSFPHVVVQGDSSS